MSQADTLQQAVARFGASVESLERSLIQLLDQQAAAPKLKEQVQALIDERNRLHDCRNIAGRNGGVVNANVGLLVLHSYVQRITDRRSAARRARTDFQS